MGVRKVQVWTIEEPQQRTGIEDNEGNEHLHGLSDFVFLDCQSDTRENPVFQLSSPSPNIRRGKVMTTTAYVWRAVSAVPVQVKANNPVPIVISMDPT
jgi:hypothetical protein